MEKVAVRRLRLVFHCLAVYSPAMPHVLLNFQHYGNAWTVHFIEADCRSTIGPKTRYYSFATLDGLRSFFTRCQPVDATLAGFEHSVRAWGRGSEYVHLTEEQYGKLARPVGIYAHPNPA